MSPLVGEEDIDPRVVTLLLIRERFSITFHLSAVSQMAVRLSQRYPRTRPRLIPCWGSDRFLRPTASYRASRLSSSISIFGTSLNPLHLTEICFPVSMFLCSKILINHIRQTNCLNSFLERGKLNPSLANANLTKPRKLLNLELSNET